MDKLQNDIEALKAGWMTGNTVASACPAEWQGLDTLSLVAVAGQFNRIATRPASPDTIELRVELPSLPLKPMPEELRPQFRRILTGKLVHAKDVVRLIAARGFCVNPIDWMPKASDNNLPPAYDAWCDWLEGNVQSHGDETLSAQTWDHFPAHSRHRDLTSLHRTDADAARELVAAVAPSLAADQRLRMLQCLRSNLTAADKPLLESFVNDRSSKVQALVKTQLARVGHSLEVDADATREVPDFLELGRAGMLSRRKTISARKLKNEAQRKRRRLILSSMTLEGVSEALGVASDVFVDIWDMGGATDEVADIIASSGTDDDIKRFATRLVEADALMPQSIMERLTPSQRQGFGMQAMASDDWHLGKTMQWFTEPDGTVPLSAIEQIKKLPDLIKLTAQNETSNLEHVIAASLNLLGLIADREAAAALVERLIAAGVMTVDPRITLLRLNAAL